MLRPWLPADADFLLDLEGRWEVVRHLGAAPSTMTSRDEALASIHRRRAISAHHVHGVWLVADHDGRRLGNLLLKPVRLSAGEQADRSPEVEVGWHLHPDAWGHGYATEAARTVLDDAFTRGLARRRENIAGGWGCATSARAPGTWTPRSRSTSSWPPEAAAVAEDPSGLGSRAMDMLGGDDIARRLAPAGPGAARPLPRRRLRRRGPLRRRRRRGGGRGRAPPARGDRPGRRRPQAEHRGRDLPRGRRHRARRRVDDAAGRRPRPPHHRGRRRAGPHPRPGRRQRARARPRHPRLRAHRPGLGRAAHRRPREPRPGHARRRGARRGPAHPQPLVRRPRRGPRRAARPRRGLRRPRGRRPTHRRRRRRGRDRRRRQPGSRLVVLADPDGNRGVVCAPGA